MPPAAPLTALKLRRIANALSGGQCLAGLPRRIARNIGRRFKGFASIDDFMGDLRLELDIAEHMQSRIFWLGGYNLGILKLLPRHLSQGMIFLDVGANIGELSLWASRLVGPDGKVVAFEPSPLVAEKLRRHVLMNGINNIQVEQIGLGPRAATMPLFRSCIASQQDEDNLGLASLISPAHGGELISHIRVEALDDWICSGGVARIDVIKVDIEGGELGFLDGAKRTIETFRPKIIIEIAEESLRAAGGSPTAIRDYFSLLSYDIYEIDGLGRAERVLDFNSATFANALCIPRPQTKEPAIRQPPPSVRCSSESD